MLQRLSNIAQDVKRNIDSGHILNTFIVLFALWNGCCGTTVSVATPGGANHIKVDPSLGLGDRKSVTFRIKACSEAFLRLTNFDAVGAGFREYAFGRYGNETSAYPCLAENPICTTTDTAPLNPLTCDEYRDFWISWYGTTMQMGQGSVVGLSLILESTPNVPFPNFFWVRTDTGTSGTFIFDIPTSFRSLKSEMVGENQKYTSTYVETHVVTRLIDCLRLCLKQEECCGVNYFAEPSVLPPCEIVKAPFVITLSVGWKRHQLTSRRGN